MHIDRNFLKPALKAGDMCIIFSSNIQRGGMICKAIPMLFNPSAGIEEDRGDDGEPDDSTAVVNN